LPSFGEKAGKKRSFCVAHFRKHATLFVASRPQFTQIIYILSNYIILPYQVHG
jgi:hypothetical protein